MMPRSSQSIRRKILIWSSGAGQEKDLCVWLQGAGYEIAAYPDVHDIIAVCAAEMPDLVILGGGGDSSEQDELIEKLQEDARTRDISILVLAAGDQPPSCAVVPRSCRIDWMLCPPSSPALVAKVRGMLRIACAEGAQIGRTERDLLTKLQSRRSFDERLEKELERARRYGRTVSCILLDIDRMQELNGTYGHAVGDELLRTLADILLSDTRSSDIVARYGGDDFAIILPETSACDAGVMCERLRTAFANRTITTPKGVEVAATASGGVATYPDHACDAATLMRMADSAAYQAKASGRNRTVIAFTEERERWSEGDAGARILLVEDNDYTRSLTSLVLRASGYEVFEAIDGAAALSLAGSVRPDLVIIDTSLHGMSGIEATRKLLEMEVMRDVPVVALTGGDTGDELAALSKAGCRGYIMKPIDTNNIASQIESYLHG
jgi:diguanylate cyclase (GGDEF)-like protein